MSGLRAAAVALAVVTFAGCSAAVTSTRTVYGPAPSVTVAPPGVSCAWYSVGRTSALVTVALTGASAAECALASRQIAMDTASEWASTSVITGALLAEMSRGGVTLRMYQTGPDRGFTVFSGYLADDLAANGWMTVAP